MKLKDIKTRTEFYEFADIWYQRVHRLKEIWQNVNNSEKRKIHAFALWFVMYKRVMKLVEIAIKINQYKTSNNFEKGGLVH